MVGHRWWTSSPKTSVAECQGRTELSEALGGFDADRALIVAECLRDDRGPGEGCAFQMLLKESRSSRVFREIAAKKNTKMANVLGIRNVREIVYFCVFHYKKKRI